MLIIWQQYKFTEIELDKNRTWCPRAGCETVCLVDPKTKDKGIAGQSGSLMSLAPVAVKCPTCVEEFCSNCKKAVNILLEDAHLM